MEILPVAGRKSKRDWSSKNQKKDQNFSEFPVQLYDTIADISETTNVAETNPELVAKLQAAYDAHVTELEANKRPTAKLIRPDGSVSSERPGGPKQRKKPQPKGKGKGKSNGKAAK